MLQQANGSSMCLGDHSYRLLADTWRNGPYSRLLVCALASSSQWFAISACRRHGLQLAFPHVQGFRGDHCDDNLSCSVKWHAASLELCMPCCWQPSRMQTRQCPLGQCCESGSCGFQLTNAGTDDVAASTMFSACGRPGNAGTTEYVGLHVA